MRLTGREHARLFARLNSGDTNVEEALRSVGLQESSWGRRAAEYSKGMRQRLALAVSLIGDPDLLILDEPSAGVDPVGIDTIRNLIREYANDGTTVVFSSHNVEEVEAVCDRIGVLVEGQLVVSGTPDVLRDGMQTPERLHVDVRQPLADTVVSKIESFDGVRTVETEATSLVVHCRGASTKVGVLAYLLRTTPVEDFETDRTSLSGLLADGAFEGRE